MSDVLVKICGTTSPADALLAQQAGADFLGIIIEHAASPRSVDLERAVSISQAVSIPVVALTVNRSKDDLLRIAQVLSPHALQLHGDETPELVAQLKAEGLTIWKALSGARTAVLAQDEAMRAAAVDAILLDARRTQDNAIVYGGTGHLSDWEVARELAQNGTKLMLAGGLTPENVAQGVREVQPWAVDAASGIEASKGIKDAAKVRAFVQAAKF